MKTKTDKITEKGKNQRSYHHGNLKQDLLTEAVHIVNDDGVNALTIRKLADRLGVSHTACYRHFSGKDAIIDAIAVEGFTLFLDAMKNSVAQADDALSQFKKAGAGYVHFAVNYPAHYFVMFSHIGKTGFGNSEHLSEALSQASDTAFQFLVSQIIKCQDIKAIRKGDPEKLALYVWASCHGLCSLNMLNNRPTDEIACYVESYLDDVYFGLKR